MSARGLGAALPWASPCTAWFCQNSEQNILEASPVPVGCQRRGRRRLHLGLHGCLLFLSFLLCRPHAVRVGFSTRARRRKLDSLQRLRCPHAACVNLGARQTSPTLSCFLPALPAWAPRRPRCADGLRVISARVTCSFSWSHRRGAETSSEIGEIAFSPSHLQPKCSPSSLGSWDH